MDIFMQRLPEYLATRGSETPNLRGIIFEAVNKFKCEVMVLLPKYQGKGNPHRHLYEVHTTCSSMKPPEGCDLEIMKILALELSMSDDAFRWFRALDFSVVNTWDKLQDLFIEKFYVMPGTPQSNCNEDSQQDVHVPTSSTLEESEAPEPQPDSSEIYIHKILMKMLERMGRPSFPYISDSEDEDYEIQTPEPKVIASDTEIWQLYEKIQVNIPLFNYIQKIPRYYEFLRRMCKTKEDTKTPNMEEVGFISTSLIKGKSFQESKVQSNTIIPCVIGKSYFAHAMLDFDCTINIMPHHVYQSLHLAPLQSPDVKIELHDNSVLCPRGILENVFVQVNGLIFPADFHIMDMGEGKSTRVNPLILGLPFIQTSKTKFDTHDGHVSMEFDGVVAHFQAPKAGTQSVQEVRMVDINPTGTRPNQKELSRRKYSTYPWRLVPEDPP